MVYYYDPRRCDVTSTPIPGGAQVDSKHDVLWLGWIFHQNGDMSPPYWRMKCLLVFSAHQDLMLLCLDQLAVVQGISSAVLINVPLFWNQASKEKENFLILNASFKKCLAEQLVRIWKSESNIGEYEGEHMGIVKPRKKHECFRGQIHPGVPGLSL